MNVVFGNWKYIAKNLLFILPFVLAPALFFALAVDQESISVVIGFMTGTGETLTFGQLFRAFSFIRTDSLLWGLVSSLGGYACLSIFMAVMLSFVEKHMRIGKRTLSGAFSRLDDNIVYSLGITAIYLAIYELWALILSAILNVIVHFTGSGVGAIVFGSIAFVAMSLLLLYVCTVFYLWFPCAQHTGFGAYEAFRYSYMLMLNVRWRLILSFAISFVVAIVVLAVCSVLCPLIVFHGIAFALYVFLILGFAVRMETLYFYTDRLDREDELRSYREM